MIPGDPEWVSYWLGLSCGSIARFVTLTWMPRKSVTLEDLFRDWLVGAISQAVNIPRQYHELDEIDARLLYAILRKEHEAFTGVTSLDGPTENSWPPGATWKYLEGFIGGASEKGRLNRRLTLLKESGYITIARYSSDQQPYEEDEDSETQRSNKPRQNIYEINAKTCITTRHAAIVLDHLLKICESKDAGERGLIDSEGRVNIEKWVKLAADDERFKGEDRESIEMLFMGTASYKGKIDELVEVGEHLERASHEHIRPRLRLLLEKRYIRMVADQPRLTQVKSDIQKLIGEAKEKEKAKKTRQGGR